MKSLIRNSVLFLSPIFVVLLFLPVHQRLKYEGLKDDCEDRGIWMHDRVYNHPKNMDVVFLGSSHTMNAIDDAVLSNGRAHHVVNMGYCRLGNNLQYVLLKEILAKKKVKMLVLEVRENEERYSHPIFPHLASTKDVLLPKLLFNRDIFSDIWVHFNYKIELAQDFLFREKRVKQTEREFGFTPQFDTAQVEFLRQVKTERCAPKRKLSEFGKWFYNEYPFGYLEKIKELCDENHVELVFLYLPSFGSPEKKPEEIKIYQAIGKVWIPPAEIMQDVNNWFDENHLNWSGGEKLTYWLKSKI